VKSPGDSAQCQHRARATQRRRRARRPRQARRAPRPRSPRRENVAGPLLAYLFPSGRRSARRTSKRCAVREDLARQMSAMGVSRQLDPMRQLPSGAYFGSKSGSGRFPVNTTCQELVGNGTTTSWNYRPTDYEQISGTGISSPSQPHAWLPGRNIRNSALIGATPR